MAAGLAIVGLAGVARWGSTRYRVTGEHFDVRSGVLVRRLRSVPLTRIRNVDLTATPVHRVLGSGLAADRRRVSGRVAGGCAAVVGVGPPAGRGRTGRWRGGGVRAVGGVSEPFMMLADAVARGDAEAERACQERVDEVLAVPGGTVQGIKLALSLQGRGTGALRMPAPELSPEVRQRIARLVEAAPAR
ncbi:hypothetical protein GCM10022419_040890 [Nonomuraea rosea]|uniref:YdbS-like PH domain-containing protein n=1 Tax=Nonomuraea rosea TaxID=638574 RepID=A0ABP6WXJ0_9ACTN